MRSRLNRPSLLTKEFREPSITVAIPPKSKQEYVHTLHTSATPGILWWNTGPCDETLLDDWSIDPISSLYVSRPSPFGAVRTNLWRGAESWKVPSAPRAARVFPARAPSISHSHTLHVFNVFLKLQYITIVFIYTILALGVNDGECRGTY